MGLGGGRWNGRDPRGDRGPCRLAAGTCLGWQSEGLSLWRQSQGLSLRLRSLECGRVLRWVLGHEERLLRLSRRRRLTLDLGRRWLTLDLRRWRLTLGLRSLGWRARWRPLRPGRSLSRSRG